MFLFTCKVDDEEKYGKRLKKERIKKYESQLAFSVASEVSRETINKMELSKTDPPLSTLRKLAKSLDMPTSKLVAILEGEE